MKDFSWNESFIHDNLYDNLISSEYSNLSTYIDENNSYLTVNNMITTSLVYDNNNKEEFEHNCEFNNVLTMTNGYFIDPGIYDHNYREHRTDVDNVPNGIGGFNIVDENDDNKLMLQFIDYNFESNKLYKTEFSWLNETWIFQYGWTTNSIFMINIYQQTGEPIKFKFNFTGRFKPTVWGPYYNSGPNPDNSEFATITQTINKYNVPFNVYTYYRWFHDSEADVKTTYTLIPYQNSQDNENQLIVTNKRGYYTAWRQYDHNSYNGGTYCNWDCNNITDVSTNLLEYGFSFYLHWSPSGEQRAVETDVQNWIIDNLQMGTNLKMCKYNTHSQLKNFIGQRVTRELDISDSVICNGSLIEWESIENDKSYVKIEANLSLDSGIHWTGWEEVTNGGKIPQLNDSANISSGVIKFRETLFAEDENNIPALYNLKLKITSPTLKYLISDGNNIKTYKYDYDWVEYLYNATGYMESNTYPEPYECSCSSEFNSYYHAYKAFNHTNDNSYDCWTSANGHNFGWLKYDFGIDKQEKLYRYVVVSRNNTDTDSAPKEWTLEASNDNTKWDIIDSQVNQIDWQKCERREFAVSMTGLYRYYRLNITKNNGNKSYVSIGELELYPLRYEPVSGHWEDVSENVITKEIFDLYGFENIENLDCSNLFELDEIQVYTSINNIYYTPTVEYRGLKKTAIRDMVRIKETESEISSWSDYSTERYQTNAIIDSKLIESMTPKTVQILAQTLNGNILSRDLPLKIQNTKPSINAKVINTRLECKLNDPNLDKIRFNVKLNGKIVYPKIGNISEWKMGNVNFNYTFTSNEYEVGKINNVNIYVEDQYGASNQLLLTFEGNYGNIIFLDENRNIYNNDIGETIKYIDFGQIFSGKMSDVKKITFKNKSGYPIKNVYIKSNQPYESDCIQFSLTNDPFRQVDDLLFQTIIYPEGENAFYVRVNTNASDVSKTETYTLKAYAEPVI